MARRFFSKKRRRKRLGDQFDTVSENLEGRAERTQAAGEERALNFDPTQAVSDFGSGFLDEAREGLGQDFESLVGSAVGRGRTRTGFFQRDAGRLFQDFNRRVSNAIAQQSLEASRQNLQNIQGLQRTGGDLLRQQIDLLGGAFDRAQGEENASGGGFFGGLAKVGGFALGSTLGPFGGAVGTKVADKIFD